METIAKNNFLGQSPCLRAAHCLLVNVVLTLVSNRNHGHNKTNGVRELVTPPQVHSDALNPGVQHVQGLFLSFRLLSFFRLGPLNWRFSAWQLVVWNFGTFGWAERTPPPTMWSDYCVEIPSLRALLHLIANFQPKPKFKQTQLVSHSPSEDAN